MSYNVTFDGDSAGGYVASGARTEKLCLPGQSWEVTLGFDCPLNIKPWSSTVIYENGSRVLTGYVSSVSVIWDKEPRFIIAGVDTWKRATDCWNVEEYVTGDGDTIQSLICRFLDMAGLSYQINTEFDAPVPAGLSILYQPVSEIVMDLCSSLSLFVRVNADGWVLIGDVVSDGGDGPALDDEIISFDMLESDYRARNKVVVWSPTGRATVRSDESWAVVDHTMVYASPYANDPWALANIMWSNLHTTEKVKTVESPGSPSRRVGQRVKIVAPDGLYNDYDICTTLKADYSTSGYIMQSIFGERCALFGGPSPIDGRDVIVATYECGVWRCRDIWADTIHWEPLNIGLEDDLIYSSQHWGSTFRCEWFIRDPYLPNTLAYLLTPAGVLETSSLEPGYENWKPKRLNAQMGNGVYISKLRSTVARQGAYYFTLSNVDTTKVSIGLTNDNWATTHVMGGGKIPYEGNSPPLSGQLWGTACNYTNQEHCNIPMWHVSFGYLGKGNNCGLAAWHRNDYGCTAIGLSSPDASNARPQIWHCLRGTIANNIIDMIEGRVYSVCQLAMARGLDCNDVIVAPVWGRQVHPWFCFLTGSPLSPEERWWTPVSDGGPGSAPAISWLVGVTIHIPYDQKYGSEGPGTIYYSPGWWEGTLGEGITAAAPTRNATPLLLPWGTNPDLCHDHQGSIGTYSPNKDKVYCFSKGKPSRFATSIDEGDSWTEKTSVSFATSCFSGFPYSSAKVYAGRHPLRDPTAPGNPPDLGDTALIEVTWDGGDTYHDVTGDLWDQTQALGIRLHPISGDPLGTKGLVTIAPRYQ